jgi:hypothetical protein
MDCCRLLRLTNRRYSLRRDSSASSQLRGVERLVRWRGGHGGAAGRRDGWRSLLERLRGTAVRGASARDCSQRQRGVCGGEPGNSTTATRLACCRRSPAALRDALAMRFRTIPKKSAENTHIALTRERIDAERLVRAAKRGEDGAVVVLLVNVLRQRDVTDRNGAIVGGLTRDDFSMTEDGRPQQIAVFERQSELPFNMTLAIDTSGSVQEGHGGRSGRGQTLCACALRPQDQMSLLQFATDVRSSRPSPTRLPDRSRAGTVAF